ISCPSDRWTIPRIACRVVCGLLDVIATLVPTSALVSVDLPALGRPTKHAKPDRCSAAEPLMSASLLLTTPLCPAHTRTGTAGGTVADQGRNMPRTSPLRSARNTGAVADNSRTAASESAGTTSASVTTAAASNPGAPLDTA